MWRRGCLDDATFAELVAHTLDTARVALAEDHLDRCADCRRHLSDLARGVAAAMSITAPRPVTDEPEASTVGRYKILDVAGSGGMGVVLRARDPMLGREVAIKIVRDRGACADRQLREARALALVDHPNVIPIYDVGLADGDVYLIMPYLPGGTLRERLADVRAPHQILALFVAAGRGLAAAHAVNIVHRDFKPSNVLVAASGAPVVADFGLSRSDERVRELDQLTDADPTQTGALAGTLRYMAPEQLASRPLDARCDQFAFAVALWEALHDRHPFLDPTQPAPSPAELFARIAAGPDSRSTSAVDTALRRALAFEPSDRWPTMDALLDALAPRRRARRRWLALAVAALATLGAAAVATRDPAPVAEPPCGARTQIAEVWNPAARAHYLADPRSRSSGDAVWLDWYARDLELEYTAWCGRAEPQRIACLDGAVGDLRQAVGRDARRYWPRLRAPDRCSSRMPPRTVGTLLRLEYALLSPTGDRIAQHLPPAHPPIVRALGSNEVRALDLVAMLRWLADGTIAGRTKDGQLVAIDPAQRLPPRQIARLAQNEVISPSMRHRTDSNGGQVKVVPIDGGRALTAPVAWDPFVPAASDFSLDGRRFAMATPLRDVVIDDLATGHRERFPCRINVFHSNETSLSWISPTSFLITGTIGGETAGDLWRISVDPEGRLAQPPLVYERAEDDTTLLVQNFQRGKLLVARTQVGARLRVLDRAGVSEIPGGTGAVGPVHSDARGRVLTLFNNESSPWGWLSLDDATTRPVPNLARSLIPTTSPTGIAALELRTDPPMLLDVDDSGAVRSRTPIVAARGTRPQLRCGAERCVLRWWAGGRAALAEVDHGTIGAVSWHDLPQLAQPSALWDLSPDGRTIAVMAPDRGSQLVLYDRATHRERIIETGCTFSHGIFASTTELVLACSVDTEDSPFRLLRLDISNGHRRELWRGTEFISAIAVVGDRVVFSATTSSTQLLLYE